MKCVGRKCGSSSETISKIHEIIQMDSSFTQSGIKIMYSNIGISRSQNSIWKDLAATDITMKKGYLCKVSLLFKIYFIFSNICIFFFVCHLKSYVRNDILLYYYIIFSKLSSINDRFLTSSPSFTSRHKYDMTRLYNPSPNKLDIWVPHEVKEINLIQCINNCDNLLKRAKTIHFSNKW